MGNINLIKELGLDVLSAEEQQKAVLNIGRVIRQNIILRVMGILSEEEKDEFDTLLGEKADDEETIINFLKSKIPNLEEIIQEEIKKFKENSVNLMEGIK